MQGVKSFHNYKYSDFYTFFKYILVKYFIYLAVWKDFVILLIIANSNRLQLLLFCIVFTYLSFSFSPILLIAFSRICNII